MEEKTLGGYFKFPGPGYVVYWGGDGLRIEAIDYHCTELRLSWEFLFDVAERAGYHVVARRQVAAQNRPVV